MSLKTRGLLVLVIGSVLGLSLSLGGGVIAGRQQPTTDELAWDQARLFAEVIERIREEYVEPVDERTLIEGAIRGMVAELDPHSEFLDAEEFQDIRISTSGSYSGIGLEVDTEDGRVVVIAPIDGTPAARAGLRSGDNIVAIDDRPVREDNLQDAIELMRGHAGSRVSVSVLRGPEAELLVFSLRREQIRVATVSRRLLEPSLAYVRISQFSENTASELSRAIDEITDELLAKGDEFRGLILDLRDNPGGMLDSAVDVSDLFLTRGVIVTADGRTQEARFRREASRGDILDGLPIVVLVNKGSASASEIVAGALQDHRRALIVGTETFGKGLVQTVMPLSKGRAIKLTTSRYFTPSGDSIHEKGIEPDIVIDDAGDHPGRTLTAALDLEGDPQLIEAMHLLDSHRILQSRAP
ncbi:MAG: S41 family peptidase [Gammaproteobacteria bacterium]|nr:S41 family peptidase [Gammaproteobacteria bacterium]